MNLYAIRAIYLFDELPRDLAGNTSIVLRDLKSSESSLEEIFINLLRNRA
jgi:hypothetical protein